MKSITSTLVRNSIRRNTYRWDFLNKSNLQVTLIRNLPCKTNYNTPLWSVILWPRLPLARLLLQFFLVVYRKRRWTIFQGQKRSLPRRKLGDTLAKEKLGSFSSWYWGGSVYLAVSMHVKVSVYDSKPTTTFCFETNPGFGLDTSSKA